MVKHVSFGTITIHEFLLPSPIEEEEPAAEPSSNFVPQTLETISEETDAIETIVQDTKRNAFGRTVRQLCLKLGSGTMRAVALRRGDSYLVTPLGV